MLFFCNQPESISHFLFQCPVAKIIWVVVAKCFGANTISGIWNNVGDGVINGCLSFGKKISRLGSGCNMLGHMEIS
jgi:hypothetical protein